LIILIITYLLNICTSLFKLSVFVYRVAKAGLISYETFCKKMFDTFVSLKSATFSLDLVFLVVIDTVLMKTEVKWNEVSSLENKGDNFINILRTNFSHERWCGSFFYVHVTREKLPKQCLYKKFVSKMFMKLTKGEEPIWKACLVFYKVYHHGYRQA